MSAEKIVTICVVRWWVDSLPPGEERGAIFLKYVRVLKEHFGRSVYMGGDPDSGTPRTEVAPLVNGAALDSQMSAFKLAMEQYSTGLLNRDKWDRAAVCAAARAEVTRVDSITAALVSGDIARAIELEAAQPESPNHLLENDLVVTKMFRSFKELDMVKDFSAFSSLAICYLTLVATSVKDECTFSAAALIMNDRRTSMSPEYLDRWLRLYMSKRRYRRLADFPIDRAFDHWYDQCTRRGVGTAMRAPPLPPPPPAQAALLPPSS